MNLDHLRNVYGQLWPVLLGITMWGLIIVGIGWGLGWLW